MLLRHVLLRLRVCVISLALHCHSVRKNLVLAFQDPMPELSDCANLFGDTVLVLRWMETIHPMQIYHLVKYGVNVDSRARLCGAAGQRRHKELGFCQASPIEAKNEDER